MLASRACSRENPLSRGMASGAVGRGAGRRCWLWIYSLLERRRLGGAACSQGRLAAVSPPLPAPLPCYAGAAAGTSLAGSRAAPEHPCGDPRAERPCDMQGAGCTGTLCLELSPIPGTFSPLHTSTPFPRWLPGICSDFAGRIAEAFAWVIPGQGQNTS